MTPGEIQFMKAFASDFERQSRNWEGETRRWYRERAEVLRKAIEELENKAELAGEGE
jgi:hypothetical protein